MRKGSPSKRVEKALLSMSKTQVIFEFLKLYFYIHYIRPSMEDSMKKHAHWIGKEPL